MDTDEHILLTCRYLIQHYPDLSLSFTVNGTVEDTLSPVHHERVGSVPNPGQEGDTLTVFFLVLMDDPLDLNPPEDSLFIFPHPHPTTTTWCPCQGHCVLSGLRGFHPVIRTVLHVRV